MRIALFNLIPHQSLLSLWLLPHRQLKQSTKVWKRFTQTLAGRWLIHHCGYFCISHSYVQLSVQHSCTCFHSKDMGPQLLKRRSRGGACSNTSLRPYRAKPNCPVVLLTTCWRRLVMHIWRPFQTLLSVATEHFEFLRTSTLTNWPMKTGFSSP